MGGAGAAAAAPPAITRRQRRRGSGESSRRARGRLAVERDAQLPPLWGGMRPAACPPTHPKLQPPAPSRYCKHLQDSKGEATQGRPQLDPPPALKYFKEATRKRQPRAGSHSP